MLKHFEELDVLIWLPGEPEPVLAGQVLSDGASTSFVYKRLFTVRRAKNSNVRAQRLRRHLQSLRTLAANALFA